MQKLLIKKVLLYCCFFSFLLLTVYPAYTQPCADRNHTDIYPYPCGVIWTDYYWGSCEPLDNVFSGIDNKFEVWSWNADLLFDSLESGLIDSVAKRRIARDTVNYQWYYNDRPVGTNAPQYTSPILQLNDQVKVVMTSRSGRCNTTQTVRASMDGSIWLNMKMQLTYCARNKIDLEDYVVPRRLLRGAHYQWTLNGRVVGTDSSVYTTPILKYNDSVTVSITGPHIARPFNVTFEKNPMSFDVTLPGNFDPKKEALALMSSLPLVDSPLTLHWLINGREATSPKPEIGGAVGNGNRLYTGLRFPMGSSALGNDDQIWLEIRDAGFCVPPGANTSFKSFNTYSVNLPGDPGNDILSISVKKIKIGSTDTIIEKGVVNAKDTTVIFTIDTSGGYGTNLKVNDITMTARGKYYPFWRPSAFPTSADLLKDKPILMTLIAENRRSKVWRIYINLKNGK